MTWEELQTRQRERYGRVLRRETTLSEAMSELDEDWAACEKATCPNPRQMDLAMLEAVR